MIRRRDERGFMAAEWVAAVGVLLVPVFVIVASATKVPEMQAAAQTIATESARAAADAGSCADAQVAATTAKRSAESALGVSDTKLDFSETDWRAGGVVKVTASVPMPFVLVPGGFQFALPTTLSAHHSEPIDRYRFLDESPCS